jgi:hypothetical protein
MIPEPQPTASVHSLDDRRVRILGPIQQVRAWSRSTGSARAVLTVLATYADAAGGSCRPAQATIAHDTGFEVRTVRRALARLVKLGELEIEELGTGRRATRYRITLSPPVDNSVDIPLFPIGSVDTVSAQGGHHDRAGRTPCPPTVHRPDIDREGDGPPRCSRHRGVEEPPPCRGCMKAREAADSVAAEQARKAAEEKRRAQLKRTREEAEAQAAAAVPPPESFRAARRATTRVPSRTGTLTERSTKGPTHARRH